MNITDDQAKALDVVYKWQKFYIRKMSKGSQHIVEVSAGQFNAADRILYSLFEVFGIDPEEWFNEKNKEEAR